MNNTNDNDKDSANLGESSNINNEATTEIIEVAPDPNNMTPDEAFWHMYQLEKHTYESESEYIERKIMRDQFNKELEDAGMDIMTVVNAFKKPIAKPKFSENMVSPLMNNLIKRI